jgi:hypothetical protein
VRWIIRIFLLLLALLLWETGVVGIPESIARQVNWLQSLGSENLIRILALLLGFVVALVAVGPTRVLAWVRVLFEPRANSEEQRAQDEALDAYLDQMQDWLSDEGRPLASAPSEDPRRAMARTRTLTVLERLGPRQKRRVLQFLQEHNLIRESQHAVFLSGADFSDADLSRVNLINPYLIGVNFSGADMRRASFSTLGAGSADMFKAQEEGVYVELFEKPTGISRLDNANLDGAKLRDATLAGCVLIGAHLNGTDLEGADLRGADLRLTEGLSQGQVNRAYGGTQQREPTQNSLLPDHLTAPAFWSKPIYEQKRDR